MNVGNGGFQIVMSSAIFQTASSIANMACGAKLVTRDLVPKLLWIEVLYGVSLAFNSLRLKIQGDALDYAGWFGLIIISNVNKKGYIVHILPKTNLN